MEATKNQILIVGLPESGKTSFLAAFYHYVDSELEDKALSQVQYPSNTEYLNFIVTKWLNCENIGRTAESEGAYAKEVVLHLVDNRNCANFEFNIPDIAGESFVRQYTDRTWELEYLEQARNSAGLLLFINPDKIRAHVLIDDTQAVLAEFLDDDENDAVPFDVEKSPSQVMLVDILDGHAETLFGRKINVALIISAWDEQMQAHKSPAKWIEFNLPMLYQYLIANPDIFNFKVFGVSAQGGSILDPEKKLTLQQVVEPAERIIIQEEDEVHKNICAPIQWVIDQW